MTGNIKMFKHIFITLSLWMILISTAQASIVQRTITINGNFNDWDGTLNPATPVDSSPGTNILTNPGQFALDALETATSPTPPTSQSSCLDKDATFKASPSPATCLLQSGGRDLESFTYTYTSTRLYVYVQRYANANNATDWYFYLDADGDNRLSDGERILGVSWTGSNGNTAISLWSYNAVDNVLGDPLTNNGTGDGYDMPGSLNASLTYNLPTSLTGGSTAGALQGRQMEAQILWSDVCSGCSGPQNINFHISSSRGTNLPSQLEDNMVGTPGGIITYDLGVTKTSSLNALAVGGTMSYTVTVTNNSVGNANSVTLTDLLPAQVTFNSFSSTHPGDTYNSGTGLWTIGTLAGGATATATFNVTANAAGTPTNTATLTNPDTDNSNNSASRQVTINAAGDLSVSKTVDDNDVQSGDALTYTIAVTNNGLSSAAGITLTDILPAEVTYSASTCSTGTYDSGTGIWTIGTINAATTVSCDIDVIADVVISATVATNTATIPYSDSNNANNTASVDITVNPPLPMLSITKISSVSSANPLEVISYTITVQNMGTADAENIEINDAMSPYSAIDIDADNAGPITHPFIFDAGTSTLALGAISYTNNAIPYSPLVSGGGGASAGFDGNPTDWKILMTGSMPVGTSFSLTYFVEVK